MGKYWEDQMSKPPPRVYKPKYKQDKPLKPLNYFFKIFNSKEKILSFQSGNSDLAYSLDSFLATTEHSCCEITFGSVSGKLKALLREK